MKERCYSKKNKRYHNYGGRGIVMCDKWLNYENFKNDMYELYIEHCRLLGEKNTTIERIDVNRNYCPENCRWATWTEQGNNTTNNVFIEYKGNRLTISQWSRKLGMKRNTLSFRLFKSKWSVEKSFNTPVEFPYNRNILNK